MQLGLKKNKNKTTENLKDYGEILCLLNSNFQPERKNQVIATATKNRRVNIHWAFLFV